MSIKRLIESGKLLFGIEPRVVERFDAESLAPFFVPHNTKIDSPSIAFAFRAAQEETGKNLFEVAGVEKCEQNVMALLGNIYRSEIASFIPSAQDATLRPSLVEMKDWDTFFLGQAEYLLAVMLNGIKEKQKPSYEDPHSLPRHLQRTTYLARNTVLQCLRGQGIRRDSGEGKIAGFGYSHLGGLHPYHIVIPASMHDEPRNFTHSSKHDELVGKLVEDIDLLPSIAKSFHQPVPVDCDVNPKTFDKSGAQRILRLADNFGKVVSNGEGGWKLRTTIDEACENSRNRQTKYFNEERDTPETFWYGKNESHLEKYLANERLMYEAGFRWFERMSGQSYTDLLEDINRDPGKYDVYNF